MKNSKSIFRFLIGLIAVSLMIFGIFDLSLAQVISPEHLISPGLAMAFIFADLDWEDEPENMGGLTSEMYIGLSGHIATWPTLISNPQTDEEAVTLQGSFAMNLDKHFIKVYSTPDTAKLEPENQGETDGQSFKQKGELFYPGTRKEAVAFARKINNARGCIIGIDPNTGERYVVGSKEKPVYFKPSVSTGGAAADRRGVKLEFNSDSFLPFAFYDGAIPLSSGDIPALTPPVTP
ncbi:MAG: hypothetical protein K0B15_06535 [Lentimicrobium sp.]|nr:hypothetical protein [Lentimicrobium sp.]